MGAYIFSQIPAGRLYNATLITHRSPSIQRLQEMYLFGRHLRSWYPWVSVAFSRPYRICTLPVKPVLPPASPCRSLPPSKKASGWLVAVSLRKNHSTTVLQHSEVYEPIGMCRSCRSEPPVPSASVASSLFRDAVQLTTPRTIWQWITSVMTGEMLLPP